VITVSHGAVPGRDPRTSHGPRGNQAADYDGTAALFRDHFHTKGIVTVVIVTDGEPNCEWDEARAAQTVMGWHGMNVDTYVTRIRRANAVPPAT
jgi:hypothetical protein